MSSQPRGADDLPACVARYFAFALGSARPVITRARIRSTGVFATKPNAWAPFSAEQVITPVPPSFEWNARIWMMKIVPVRVRDSYDNGYGATHATVAKLVTLANTRGTREVAAASLQRFLAEAVWVPTALLPRDGLSWSPIDDAHARVTITDRDTTVSLDITFGSRGEIVSVAGLRYRDVDGAAILTPWEGVHRDYQSIDGIMIPTSGEVAWGLPDGRVPYWRGRLADVRFER